MNRKPIFDAVRKMLGRGYTRSEITALDLACDLAEAAVTDPLVSVPKPITTEDAPNGDTHLLGALSEKYESGGRGPGVVSSGQGDPGGVSYGVYQLSSNAGTLTTFMKAEGSAWKSDFGNLKHGGTSFSNKWKDVAKREPKKFRAAQHKFIERTHYRPVVKAVLNRKGLDLDARHNAVRDATWSCSVQHGGAATILNRAIDATDIKAARTAKGYDRRLLNAIYKARIDYVVGVASNTKLPKSQRNQLISITKKRYPDELAAALKMLDANPITLSKPEKVDVNADGTIDGNELARQHGVNVKSRSVKISKLDAKMGPVIPAVAEVVRKLGVPTAVITSGNDSRHGRNSLHFKNQALDFRGNNVSVAVGRLMATEISNILGKDFDVLFETFTNVSNNHLHIEYDPD